MGFLSPWFLAGLLAVGLPLWLHLLRQYRRTPQPFSSLMFFERRVQASSQHRRLRYLLLLALRLALLVLLALAFANPFVNRTNTVAGKRTLTVIAFDRSFSMRAGNRIQQAKNDAQRLIAGLGGRELLQVIAFDSHVENMTAPELDKGAVTAAIQSVQPSDSFSSFGELARALRVMAQNNGMHQDVHLFSDMQQTSMPSNFRDLALGPNTSLQLHSVGGGAAPNWAVEAVTTSEHVYDVHRTQLTATVAGWQTQAATQRVDLVLNGKVAASKEVSVPANGHASVEFLAFDVPYGVHRGAVRISPRDALPSDDEFVFSVERSDPRRVLFLYAGGRSREAFFYKAALDSAADTGLSVEPLPMERVSERDLSKYAFIVLNDLGELDEGLTQKLCGYVQHGGAALIVLGPTTVRSGRLPLSSNGRLSEVRQVQGVSFVDNQNPALAGAGRFENVQFFQAAGLTPKAHDRVLAKLADGSPLLVEERMGEGRALVFASTLDNSTNDFPLHTGYLPFVAQTGRYLAGAEDTPSSVVAGTAVTLRRTRDESTAADVVGPDGRHELSLAESTKALSFDLNQGGFYEVQRANGQRQLLAVHADRRESDLTAIPQETLDLWRNTGSTAVAAKPGNVAAETRPWSLWRYVMILVLMAALMESLFASRYLKQERQTA
ncbi:MAG: BatA domain-containing protein [Bryobacteraceae bacterium]